MPEDIPAQPPPTAGAILADVFSSANRPAPIQRLIAILASCEGRFDTAEAVATAAGFRDRHDMYRALLRCGLPPLTELARLVRALHWLERYARERVSLSRQAIGAGRYESQYSREFRRALGVPWSVVRARGPEWLIRQVRKRYAA